MAVNGFVIHFAKQDGN